MRISTAYIFKQVVIGFLILTMSLLGIVWLTQSLRFINMTIGKGLPFALFIKITVLLIPKFLLVLSPISMFAVVLFVYNRMNMDREIIVFKSSGFDNYKLAKPTLFFSIIMTAVGFVFSMKIIPETYTAFRDLQWQIRNDVSHMIIQEGTFNALGNNMTVYVEKIDSHNHLKNIIIGIEENNTRSIVLAESGALIHNNDVPRIIMNNGSRHEVNRKTGIFSLLNFDNYTIDFDSLLDDSKKRLLRYEELSIRDLREILKSPDLSEKSRMDINVEIHSRFVKPLFNIAFAILGCVGVLLGYFNRNGNLLKTCFVIAVMVIIQSLALAFENFSAHNNVFIVFMYLLPLLTIFGCLYFLLADNPFAVFAFGMRKTKSLLDKS